MRAEALSAGSILEAMNLIDKCASCDAFGSMTISESNEWVKQCRLASVAIPGRHKKEFICLELQDVVQETGESPKFGVVNVNGRQCCTQCFRSAYGFDKSVWYVARRAVANGDLVEEGAPKEHTGRGVNKQEVAKAWCTAKYLENVNSVDPGGGQIMVDKPDRTEWYAEFCMDQNTQGLLKKEEHAAPRTFFKEMVNARKSCKNPTIMHRKYLPFARCGACHNFKCELLKSRNPLEREEIKAKRKEHLEQQYAEREKYYKHREKAMKKPEKYMSMIIDGMDQAKLDIPHFARATKGNSTPLGNSIIGVLVHGVEFKQFVVSHSMKGGANEMMTVLNTALRELQERYSREDRTWPEVLYLQLDNTHKDNKNRGLMTYLEEVIHLEVFRKVKVSFLFVGHTHEDIDQRFSVISRYLRRNDVLTMQAFLAQLRNLNEKGSKEKIVTAKTLHWMYDFSAWAIACVDPRFKQFTKHHVFRFKRVSVTKTGADGISITLYEARTHAKQWGRRNEDGQG